MVALNLRPGITSLAPVLTQVEHSTGLSNAEAGLLTTLPVLAFGAFSLMAVNMARRIGMEATVGWSLLIAVVGLAIRAVPSLTSLFLGTAAFGVGIAVCNVVVPALIRRDFPARVGLATGVYSVALSAGAALAAGLTVPLEHATGTGWRGGLALWAVPVAAAVAVWSLQARGARHEMAPVRVSASLWRDPLAWKVTAFMGLQSFGFYSTVAWVPTVFEDHGVHASLAGWLLSLAGFASLPTAFAAPIVASTPARRRWAVVATVALCGVALFGLILAPEPGAFAWMVLLGLGQGMALSLSLNFIVVRAPSTERAAELSGMAQTVGYLLASVGPFLLGALHDATGGWTVSLCVLIAFLVPQLVSGLGASGPDARRRHRPPAGEAGRMRFPMTG